MTQFSLDARMRLPVDDGKPLEVATRQIEFDFKEAAVIICDMWDTHHCISAARRTAEMAPRMNEVISGIRKEGALIIHAPNGCMAFYDGSPQRSRAQEAPHADAPFRFGWNGWESDREVEIRAKLRGEVLPGGLTDIGPCSCHASVPCCEDGHYPWIRQNEGIDIADEDAITDDGQQVYNLLQQRAIENVMVMGVHTNVCVLSQPYGIRQLYYVGKKPLLCRDLTDSFHEYDGGHFQGTDLIIEYIERFWCPTVTSDQLVGGKPFRFREDKREQQ